MPLCLAFYIQGSGVPVSGCGAWSGSVCKVHIALQELQAAPFMLPKVAYQLSNNVVALHLDNSIAKAYLCNHDGTATHFPSRLACYILNMATKHGITLIPAYLNTHFNVEANYLSWVQLVPEWHLLPYMD